LADILIVNCRGEVWVCVVAVSGGVGDGEQALPGIYKRIAADVNVVADGGGNVVAGVGK